MGLINGVYNRVCELTNKNHLSFSGAGSVIHYWLEKTAYFAAKYDNNSKHPDIYWNAAKAFFALNFTGKVDMPLPSDKYSKPGFIPNKSKIKNIEDLDEEDREIIKLGLQFSGCRIDCPTPRWFNSLESYIPKVAA